MLEMLEPEAVWDFFSHIAAIPHPSKKEGRIRQYVRSAAENCGLTVREDSAGNVLIEVPPSAGFAGAPITVLQGHLDMVGEKNADCPHDFDRDPLRLAVDDDPEDGGRIVRAEGTTLGADNGIGVAMALAAATSPDVVHGPLELLFTVDEEAGMTGADALTADFFRGRRLLNLDSEEDDMLYIGCAGGCDCSLSWEFALEPPEAEDVAFRITVSGLRGGHSGSDIHESRGNGIKLLGRALGQESGRMLRLASISGGRLRNAIPRDAEAAVWGPSAAFGKLQVAAERVVAEAARESAEKNVRIDVKRVPRTDVPGALSVEQTQRLLAVLAALPDGVLGMHRDIEGLVETSNNVATVKTDSDEGSGVMRVGIGTLCRSSSASRKRATVGQIAAVGWLAGATVTEGNDYPGWEPNVDSPTLATCRRVYQSLFGDEPKATAIHAGLECGIIGERVEGMDMVSFGPRIEGAHTPNERVYVASVQKSWKYLLAVLAELAWGK